MASKSRRLESLLTSRLGLKGPCIYRGPTYKLVPVNQTPEFS